MSDIRAFLARAVPWPTAEQPGFVDIHWTNRDPATGAFKGLTGYAYTDHAAASGHVRGMTRLPVDLYVCMSLQRDAEAMSLSKKGKPRRRAMRSWDGALLLRSFWTDVDVKPGFFASTAEAMEAFRAWCAKVGMPEPTFIIMTGSGGFHAHWVLDEPIPRETWLPVAYAIQHALKVEKFPCDYGVVVNPACILRIPGTKNHKLNPPGDVVLAQALPFAYPFAFIEQQMAPYKVPYALPVTTAAVSSTLPFKPNPKLAGLTLPPLDAGIDTWLPSLEEVADACPFMEAARVSHGKGYSEPLWYESLKVVAFCKDAIEVAHEISDGHDGYDEADTDQKFAQVAAIHGGGKVGWPQCRTINAAGATECTQCEHFIENKSPLNYVVPVTPTPAPAPPPLPTTALVFAHRPQRPQPDLVKGEAGHWGYNTFLPAGYRQTIDGTLQVEIELEDKTKGWEPVFPNPIYHVVPHKPTTDGIGTWGLSFWSQVDATYYLQVVVSAAQLADLRAFAVAIGQQVGLVSKHTPKLREFLLSFRDQLLARGRTSKNSEAFGWSAEEGKSEPNAFCYNGLRYTAAGTTSFAPTDTSLAKKYQPTGSLSEWKKAAALIVDQQRPDLICALAASFGAPLVFWTGMSGSVLSLWSNASGVGKTHILRVSQAVWGNPKTGMGTLNDTDNFVTAILSQLRHLPFFYDELRQEADTKKMVNIIFGMGQGKSKGRMSASAEVKEVFGFSTLLTVASNTSLMNYINEHVQTTAAGINRIFEIEIRPAPGAPGQIDSTVAEAINGALEHNFGHAGQIYAEYLGRNVANVRLALAQMTSGLNAHLKADHDERFWVTTVAVMLLGAKYANHLGLTTIDELKLAAFLINRFEENRRYRKSAPVNMEDPSNVQRYLQDYVNSRRENTLRTDTVWTQPHRPPATFKAQQINANVVLDQKAIFIRVGEQNKVMRISRSNFALWLAKERNVQRDVIIKALVDVVKARAVKASLGASTRFITAREDLLEFDLTTLPDLFD